MSLSTVRPVLFALYFPHCLSFLFFFSFSPIGRSFAQELVIQRGDQELFANYRFDEKEERLFSWGTSGHSVRMWDAGTGHLVDEFYLDNAAMIMSVAFSDSTGRLACTSLGNIMQVWNVRTRESMTVPLEFGDMWVQARGSQFLVFSADRVKLFDAGNLNLRKTITLRKGATPTSMIGVVNNIYTYQEGWVVVSMDSVSVYDRNFAFRKRWPMAIDGAKPFVNSLAFDERRHALVLYDINQQAFALLDVESGVLSHKMPSGALSGASFCGDHFLLLDEGVSPKLMDLGNGKLVDIDAKLPQGKGLRKLFGNDRWLVCSQQLSLLGNSEKDRVFAFINPNTLETMFRDTVAPDEVAYYVTVLGKRHFAYLTTDRSLIGRTSHSPRIYDLRYDNLTGPVPPALNTLSAVYAQQLIKPNGSLKQQLQAGIFRNFNRQNEPSGVFFSSKYQYLLTGGLGEKLLKKRIGDSLVLVKKLDWGEQPVGFADFTPDERYLLVKRDSMVNVVRTADGAILSHLKLAHQIFLGSFCSDNAHAWVIGDPFKVDLLDLKTLNWSSITFPWAVSSMARIDSLNFVACTSNGIYTVNVATREIKPFLNNHKTLAIASDPVSQKLYTLMDDGTVRVINLKDREITTLSDGSSGTDLSLTWGDVGSGATVFQHFFLSYDRHYLVTHTRDDQIRVWDLPGGKVIFRVKLAGINTISIDSRRHLLLALTRTQIGTSQDEVRVFDLLSGATVFSSMDEVHRIQQHPPTAISDLVGASISVSSPNGTSQVSPLTYKQIRVDPNLHYLWMLSGQMMGVLNLWDLKPMNWSRTARAFFVDGFRDSLAMVRSNNGWAGFINPVTRDTSRVPFGPESYIPISGHFPGYSYAIKQRYDKDKGILYDFKWYNDQASRLLVWHRMATEIVQVVASPDMRYVATSTDYERAYPDTAFLFDAASGAQTAARAGAYYRTFFSSDNRYWICLVHGKQTPVFDLEKREWRMIDLDGVDVQPMAGGHLVKSDSKLVDLEDARVYPTNLTVITEVDNGQAYGLSLSGEVSVYQLAINTFKNFSFQQTGGFSQALVSPDKRFLVTLGFDGFVTKWDLQTGLLAAQAPIDYEPQRTIYFNTDSTFVVTVNAYKAVTFSLKTLHPKYTFAPGDNGTLNYFLADGSYFVDRSDLNNYYFNCNGGLFGYTQFDLHFNRPDKVLAALDVKQPALIQQYHEAVLKRLPNQTIPNFDVTNLHAPEIRVLNERRLPPRVLMDTITVAVEAEDVRSPLAALRVMINGNPVSAGHLVGSAEGKKMAGSLLLHLGEGHNRIDLSCINTDGVASLVKSVEITCAAVRPAPKTYYVGIGLDHYLMSQQLPRLNFSRKDIHTLGSLLAMDGPVIADTLCDRQVTAKAIDSLLQRLSGIEIDDKVVVFFSGHGLRVGGDFFLSTYKVDPVQPAGLGYNFSRMEKLLAAIPARQKLVLIDACNSGQSDQDRAVNEDPYAAIDPTKKKATGYARSFDLMQDLFADVSSATGTVVICASRSTQFANEGKTNGVFTECLIRGIGGKEADSDGNHKITVEELKNYLITSVPKSSPDKQQPVTRGDIPGLDWPLIKLP